MVRSQDNNLEIQMRMEPWGKSTTVSGTTALAMRVVDDEVSVYKNKGAEIVVNGVAKSFDSILELDSGGRIKKENGFTSVIWPDGSRLSFKVAGGNINTRIWLANSHRGKLVGLYGNYDGDASNDLIPRNEESDNDEQWDNEVVEGVNTKADPEVQTAAQKFHSLYKVFGQSWQISEEESLFHYEEDESTASFVDSTFPSAHITIADLPADVRADAELACRDAGISAPNFLNACILDVGVTGDKSIIESTLLAANDFGGHIFWRNLINSSVIEGDQVDALDDPSDEDFFE